MVKMKKRTKHQHYEELAKMYLLENMFRSTYLMEALWCQLSSALCNLPPGLRDFTFSFLLFWITYSGWVSS